MPGGTLRVPEGPVPGCPFLRLTGAGRGALPGRRRGRRRAQATRGGSSHARSPRGALAAAALKARPEAPRGNAMEDDVRKARHAAPITLAAADGRGARRAWTRIPTRSV